MKRFLLSIFFLCFVISAHGQSTLDSFFKATDSFLAEHVENGLVDYSGIRENPAFLNRLVEQIAGVSLEEASPREEKAFYINSYNILNIHSIIEHGIPESPMDVTGYFDEEKHMVAGEKRTLDEIEKETLYKKFPDARLHFVLVCAARGCPPIRPFAYLPHKLDRQIHRSAVQTLNSDYFTRLKPKEGKVLVSEIFKWYESDFLEDADSIRSYINSYRDKKIDPDMAIDYYSYDWSLNKLN